MLSPVRSTGRRRPRVARWLAGAIVLALLLPGLAGSTVPPAPNLTDLTKWSLSPKTAPPKDYAAYTTCAIQTGVGLQASESEYCDPPSSGGSSSPPTYWTSFWSYEFVWRSRTYRYEVTVPFSSWADRPPEMRLLVGKIRVEITGPTGDPVLASLSLWDGDEHTFSSGCCLLRHRPPYSMKDFGAAASSARSSGAQASGTFWFGYGYDPWDAPVIGFELPIVAEPVNRLAMTDGTCHTYNWESYPCHGYITIQPA